MPTLLKSQLTFRQRVQCVDEKVDVIAVPMLLSVLGH
jgi:hypothetical protein